MYITVPISLLPGIQLIGRKSYVYDELWLHTWQQRWIDILELSGSSSGGGSSGGGGGGGGGGNKSVMIKGSELSGIDGMYLVH